MNSFVFVDIDATNFFDLRDALIKLDPSRYSSCSFLHASFENVLHAGCKLCAAISPANCQLFYDGGVDAAYLEAFSNIQKDAHALMKGFEFERH